MGTTDGAGTGTEGTGSTGTEGTEGTEGKGGTGSTGTEGKGGTELGEGGVRALNAERQARAQAEREAAAAKAELEKLKERHKTAEEKAIDAAKAEGRAEALATATARIVKSEIRAAAAGKFHDAEDAIAGLGDLTRFVNKDGEPDGKAISSAIEELGKAKPWLLATSGKAGPLRGGGAKPSTGQTMNDLIRGKARG